MSRVTELEKALTTLFRKGTEVGYTETEIDEFLENIDYHALLQAVWNKAETVYAYISKYVEGSYKSIPLWRSTVFGWTALTTRSSRSVWLSPPAQWTTRRCWRGCGRTALDPLLTQNPKKAGRAGRKQRKIHRVNGGKKHKSEPKRLRFALETTYGPEGRGFESLTACQKSSKS